MFTGVGLSFILSAKAQRLQYVFRYSSELKLKNRYAQIKNFQAPSVILKLCFCMLRMTACILYVVLKYLHRNRPFHFPGAFLYFCWSKTCLATSPSFALWPPVTVTVQTPHREEVQSLPCFHCLIWQIIDKAWLLSKPKYEGNCNWQVHPNCALKNVNETMEKRSGRLGWQGFDYAMASLAADQTRCLTYLRESVFPLANLYSLSDSFIFFPTRRYFVLHPVPLEIDRECW